MDFRLNRVSLCFGVKAALTINTAIILSPTMPSDKSKVARRYDRWSGVYDSVDTFPIVGRAEKRWRLEAIAMLDLQPDDLVLDVGTGTGLIIPWIAEHLTTGKVIGIDISEKMLARARERAEKCGVAHRVELKIDDAENMSFRDGTFDKIIATYTMTTVPEPEKTFREMVRVLKDDGKIVILDTGKPRKGASRAVHFYMTPFAKFFGLTHIDRDMDAIASTVDGIVKMEEKRYYGGMVYSNVWVKG